MNYKQRLVIELKEIIEKRTKLECYIKYNCSEHNELELLKRQIEAMMLYENTLTERLFIMLDTECSMKNNKEVVL